MRVFRFPCRWAFAAPDQKNNNPAFSEPSHCPPRCIQTAWGCGYVFMPDIGDVAPNEAARDLPAQ